MLIFDMDGVLTDSNGIWLEVDTTFLQRRNMPYTKEYYEGVAHTVFPKAAEFTKAYCGLSESLEEIMAEWMELAGDMYAVKVPVKGDVRDYLDKCQARGERMVVLTSAVPEHCRAALDHLDLRRYFEGVYFAQEIGLDKTDPSLYHKVAELLDVKPEECSVFDDSLAACRSAKAAGMRAIGVYDKFFSQNEAEMTQVCDKYIYTWDEM